MNVFRLCGDMAHLLSILVLLLKISGMRSCRGALRRCPGLLQPPARAGATPVSPPCALCAAGVSLKTQELYLLVFVTRYLDLFTNFVSL
jgi:ER lumen protein retaining receptor